MAQPATSNPPTDGTAAAISAGPIVRVRRATGPGAGEAGGRPFCMPKGSMVSIRCSCSDLTWWLAEMVHCPERPDQLIGPLVPARRGGGVGLPPPVRAERAGAGHQQRPGEARSDVDQHRRFLLVLPLPGDLVDHVRGAGTAD